MADISGIEYEPHECEHEGDCPGTCPLCDAELQELNRMQLVLERMTRNIVADIRKERLANGIKDIANKHNGNEQSRKKNP